MKPSSAVKQLSYNKLYQLSVSSQFHFIKIYKYYYYGLFTADQCYENSAKLKQLSLYIFFRILKIKSLWHAKEAIYIKEIFFFWFSVVILHNNFWDSRTYVVLVFF